MTGTDAITPMPGERWNHAAFYDPEPATPGHIAPNAGGFVGAIDTFDPAFFGIAPREAEGDGPTAAPVAGSSWEALENAGQAPDRLEVAPTGVFIGAASQRLCLPPSQIWRHRAAGCPFHLGIAHSVVSGRLSYLLGLQGPSLTVDTACSSSLVAVHLACQALRNRNAGWRWQAVSILSCRRSCSSPCRESRMLAPDGRCKTFDAAADGFGRGEGCGVMVLKRLSDAQRRWRPGPGGYQRQRGQPGWPEQQLDRPERPGARGGHPLRAGVAGHRTASGRLYRGTWHRNAARRSAGGAGAGCGVRRRQAADPPLLLGSVKTNLGHLEARRRGDRHDQDRAGAASSHHPAASAFSCAEPAHRLGRIAAGGPGRTSCPGEPIGGRRIGGVSCVRLQRHQRACDRRGSAGGPVRPVRSRTA